MLGIMDTYNGDDILYQYEKSGNHNNNSILINYVPKKMQSQLSHRSSTGDPCRVCGFEKNTGRNFGVITCSTCKAFFRRNGRTGSALPSCRFGSQCPVNERTRRQCPTCRLAKCFAVGMQKDLIRTDEERASRLQLVKANRLQRQEKLLAVSLSAQTTPLQKPHRRVPHETPRMNFNQINKISTPLSSNDWIQLTNIRSAYEHYCLHPILQAEEQREEYLSGQPLKCRLKEHTFMNVLTVRLTSLVSFFRATIPFFSMDLNSNDRAWLVRTNLHYLLLFSSMDLMSVNGNQTHFDSKRSCHAAYLYVYGQDLLLRAEYLIQKLKHLIDFDPAISKIVQIILFLSPSLLTNYDANYYYQPSEKTISDIVQAQEQYINILWSYLIYRHGHENGQKLLMAIMGQVLEHQNFGADVDKSLLERQPFGDLVYSMLMSFSRN
ncbi:unnamed protein product [Rotaria socialis]|uniref:Nuclear receptor domain-containing protein n=2 Tax=Rotaria socialis TaxID=392032 RepID=A0A820JAQ1_9BILA|nr:unnamed protein product [Rotaria socialis]CAF3467384.1 unnamed protein product [Rotaria socialis]CAF4106937.1 unnamed protein product [Rotaria socialis]CAF4324127.1 unnamed protein product [Rotaria socialis]CAF4408177.1 unnamed protein product [Rotaria socialis]